MSSGANESEGVSLGLDNPRRADLGEHCLRMHVPETAPAGWRGWHQDVPVRPGHHLPRGRGAEVSGREDWERFVSMSISFRQVVPCATRTR